MDNSGTRVQAQQGVTANSDGSNVYIMQPGQAVGWAAVEKAVREDDELQVRSCKEDIDTLLTFASPFNDLYPAYLHFNLGPIGRFVLSCTDRSARTIIQYASGRHGWRVTPSPPSDCSTDCNIPATSQRLTELHHYSVDAFLHSISALPRSTAREHLVVRKPHFQPVHGFHRHPCQAVASRLYHLPDIICARSHARSPFSPPGLGDMEGV